MTCILWCFCKFWIKLLHPFKSYWSETTLNKNRSKKRGHNWVKILRFTPFFKLDLYLMMLYPSVKLEWIYASLQGLSIGNQKCDNADDDDAVGFMIPMCRPCFAGDTKKPCIKKSVDEKNHAILQGILLFIWISVCIMHWSRKFCQGEDLKPFFSH